MKQTALEWLESRISILIPEDIGSQLMFKSNIAKAKEMEKQQIIDAVDGHPLFARPFEGTDYYDEVYKK